MKVKIYLILARQGVRSGYWHGATQMRRTYSTVNTITEKVSKLSRKYLNDGEMLKVSINIAKILVIINVIIEMSKIRLAVSSDLVLDIISKIRFLKLIYVIEKIVTSQLAICQLTYKYI